MTNLVLVKVHLGDGLIHLVVIPTSTGKRLAARMLCRTNTQLRSARFTHLGERVKVMAPHGGLSSLFHSGRGLSPDAVRAKRCVEACRLLAWCLLRVVMFLGVVARHAQSCRVISWISCLPSASASQTSTPTRCLPVLREQFQPAALPLASRRNRNLTSTDCDVNLGTESGCESCNASSENQVLYVAVITKAEGRR